jgi:hypothetical protein
MHLSREIKGVCQAENPKLFTQYAHSSQVGRTFEVDWTFA